MGGASQRESIFGFSGTAAKIAAVAILLLSVSLLLFAFPEDRGAERATHDLIRKLYFLPILVAASWFGARGPAAVMVPGASFAE